MKTIGNIKIERRDSDVIDITLMDGEDEMTQGVDIKEATGIAYYLLGLTDSMMEE